ncbi:hypothetical protein DAI22_04g167450 [Oryza sativa Japonica Group]|nr:hypothetical protein DAI22_04g167450 [Oryza sativa Japonica Group]
MGAPAKEGEEAEEGVGDDFDLKCATNRDSREGSDTAVLYIRRSRSSTPRRACDTAGAGCAAAETGAWHVPRVSVRVAGMAGGWEAGGLRPKHTPEVGRRPYRLHNLRTSALVDHTPALHPPLLCFHRLLLARLTRFPSQSLRSPPPTTAAVPRIGGGKASAELWGELNPFVPRR